MAIASTTKVILPTTPASAKTPGDDPTELHPEIVRLRADSRLARSLMGGTKAMRATREIFLPRMRHEIDDTYNARLGLTALRNFYRQSLTSLAGKLMRNGLNLEDGAGVKFPKEAEEWLKNMDGEGTPGDVLFKRIFTWSVRDAASWLLADYPRTGGTQTLADQRTLGIRPMLVPLSCLDIFGWREEKVNGRMVTTQLRYLMVSDEPVGLYGRQRVETVRVIEPDRIIDLRLSGRNKWEIFDESVNTFGRVALTRIASDMDEDYRPRGGMTDLADLNLEHWQIRSDQRLALRVNSFPILFGSGMDGQLPPIGPETSILADNESANLRYVESSGASLSAGRIELTDLEDTMRAMSAQYQVKQVAQTATGAAIDAADANAPAQGWAINCKRGFEKAMSDMAEYAGLGKGVEINLRVDTDALVSSMSADKLLQLQSARATREISRETYLAALKRADILPDEYDPVADQALIDQEAPDLSGMNTPPGTPPGAPPKPVQKP